MRVHQTVARSAASQTPTSNQCPPPRSTILQSVLVLGVLIQLFGAAPGSRSDCYDAAVADPSPP
eukprot:2610635-Pyramimonas_sp.AAC.1